MELNVELDSLTNLSIQKTLKELGMIQYILFPAKDLLPQNEHEHIFLDLRINIINEWPEPKFFD